MESASRFCGFARLVPLVVAIAAAGCSPQGRAPTVAVESYSMRGEIVRLPPPGTREIAVRHEAVPDFRDESGKVVGMGAMTMPFTLAPEVSLSGLAPGDRISFTLEMRWKETRDIARIAGLEKLPAETKLSWEEPAAPESISPPGSSDSTPK